MVLVSKRINNPRNWSVARVKDESSFFGYSMKLHRMYSVKLSSLTILALICTSIQTPQFVKMTRMARSACKISFPYLTSFKHIIIITRHNRSK